MARIFTDEHKKKLSKALKRNWQKKEYKEMMSDNHKGQVPWHTGKKRPLTEEWKAKIKASAKPNKTSFKKGQPAWNKGISNTWSPTPKPMVGADNPAWKGDNAGYMALHNWIKRQKGKANKCMFCGKEGRKYEWSNISRTYKRDVTDWQMLCKECHRAYDHPSNRKEVVYG